MDAFESMNVFDWLSSIMRGVSGGAAGIAVYAASTGLPDIAGISTMITVIVGLSSCLLLTGMS